jgi:hypothetical protein
MFTGITPHGTDYASIERVAPGYKFLDEIVAKMLRQTPNDRPSSIAQVKALIQRYHAQEIATQKLSSIKGTVIPAEEIDEPLAENPPRLIDYRWDGTILTLILDRPVNPAWIRALHDMGGHSYLTGKPPSSFNFNGNEARIAAQEHQVQPIIDHFKPWLPNASRTLKQTLQFEAHKAAAAKRERLRQQQELEEAKLRVLSRVKI